MLVVVQLGAEDDISWAVGGGDASRQGKCIEPYQYEGHDLNDYP